MNKKSTTILVLLLLISNGAMALIGNYTLIRTKEMHINAGDKTTQFNTSYLSKDIIDKQLEIIEIINSSYLNDFTKEQLMDGLYTGLLDALNDPYTEYMNKDKADRFMEDTTGIFGGIGIVVTPGDDGYINIISPIEDTPGHKAGLMPNDKIIKVNGVEFLGKDMDEAVSTMRGEPGTEVTITIKRIINDEVEVFDLDIIRELIKIESVKFSKIGEIGYIRVTSFDYNTLSKFKEAIEELRFSSNGLIIDLRNNPGGIMDTTISMVDEFLDEGLIVYTTNKTGNENEYYAKKGKVDIPMVVLINQGSASASEIFAAAIKDYEIGILIGEKTFGKGVVQKLLPLSDGSLVKITTSEYFSPKGNAIHGVGVNPDIEVILDNTAPGIGINYLNEDNQLIRALEEIEKITK